MKKILALASIIGFSGVSFAGSPALSGYAPLRMPDMSALKQIEVPAPSLQNLPSRWWSVDFFGSAHKAIMKAALNLVNDSEMPDIARTKDLLLPGANDETGHPDKTANGGPVKEIWLGNTPFSKGGVLSNYEHFKFPEAYSRLGTLCHLTQDQAVPAHAANILHSVSESFEGYSSDGNKVKIETSRYNEGLEPYAYYQDLQDETRSRLASWKNPATGLPYWLPAADAPRMGQDATYGSRGQYGGGRDAYAWQNNNSTDGGNSGGNQITASPEIRARQLAIAGATTVAVLKSASKHLPPLVSDLTVTLNGRTALVSFTALDNRSRGLEYSIAVYKDGARQGTPLMGMSALNNPAAPALMLTAGIAATINLSYLPAGDYTLDVRLTDTDGNVTPDEVNTDDIPQNDTKARLTLN
jgi:hypothetical protein